MTEKLLPCPFCGGEASVHRCEHAFYDAKIRCAGCQAEGPIFDVDDGEANEAGRNEAEAIAAWNRRTPAPEKEASCIESALVKHLRSLGCVCSKPLVGYRPNAGPRCRLCNVEPASPVVPVKVRERVLDELDKAWLHGQRRTSWRRDESADAILAAFRQPVVPVGMSREEFARIIDPVSWEALDVCGQDKAAFIGLTTDHSLAKADRILAALAPTDTGEAS